MSTTMTGKRPLPPDDNASASDSKRVRSNNGSPAVPESDMERKKREATERMAAVKARLAASRANAATPAPVSAPAPPPPPAKTNGAVDIEAKKAEAQRKIAEMKAKMQAQRGQAAASSPANGGLGAAPTQAQSEREARIAEARARAAELSKQRNTAAAAPTPAPPPPPRQDGRTAKGGLGIGLHPSLMGDTSSTARGKQQQGPKFSTTKGNQQQSPPIPQQQTNPYLPAEDETPSTQHDNDPTYDPTVSTRKGGDRKSKQLVFNPKGKFMAQANALRQQARLEEMKRRIATETRKTEIEEASDKAFLVPAPPEVEWWDEGLLAPATEGHKQSYDHGATKIDTPDSIITALIQHPVMLAPPQDKFVPAPKPLMLTTTETKKLRRQRRMADMKEEQAKIRLGLIEPPAPKVKKSNMMRVLGEQAVKDPTAVEARVNKEIAARASEHVKANEDRKLTKEQRAEKLKAQQLEDEKKGVKLAVFRINDLSSGKHRYQIDINAKQHGLTGMVVLHPEMNLVIVEGGDHSIQAYKKLLLNRIQWTENTLPLSNTNSGTFTASAERQSANPEAGASKAAVWCNPLDPVSGELKSLEGNACSLVWEGDEQARAFKKWGSKACETDGEAREILVRQRMENMWTLARSR